MKKKTIMHVVVATALIMTAASTSHAGWLGGVDVKTDLEVTGGNSAKDSYNQRDTNNRYSSHTVTNSKNVNFGSQSNSNSSGNSSGGGWGWFGWGGRGATDSSISNTDGTNNGLMGSGSGNSNSMNLGDMISTGNTYNGDATLADKQLTERAAIEANRQIELQKLSRQ